jgi:predicted nucleic acid-binding protein
LPEDREGPSFRRLWEENQKAEAFLEKRASKKEAQLRGWVFFGEKKSNLLHSNSYPADDKFIACAISLHAEYIVSGDLHLKRAGKFGNVKIVPPREILSLIETGD